MVSLIVASKDLLIPFFMVADRGCRMNRTIVEHASDLFTATKALDLVLLVSWKLCKLDGSTAIQECFKLSPPEKSHKLNWYPGHRKKYQELGQTFRRDTSVASLNEVGNR